MEDHDENAVAGEEKKMNTHFLFGLVSYKQYII